MKIEKTNPRSYAALRWRAVLIVISILFAGCALALSTTGKQLYADGIVPVLMSLYQWKPFFWETARYGMLIPLIASPIIHPFWNLVFQYVIYAAGLIAAPFLIARFVYGPKYGLAVGAAAGVVLIAVFSWTDIGMSYATPGQPYGVALSFCYAGLYLLWRTPLRQFWKFGSGFLLIAAAMWLCPTVALNAIPITVAKAIRDTSKQTIRTALPLVTTVIVSLILSTAFTLSMQSTEGKRLTALLTFREWRDLNAFLTLARGLDTWFLNPIPHGVAIITGLYMSAVLVTIAVGSKLSRHLVLGGAATLLFGVASEMLVLSSMRYVSENKFDGHYLFSCLLLLLIVPCAALVIPALETVRRPRLESALLAGLVVAAIAVHGWPSLRNFRASLDTFCGQHTEKILANRATHIAGAYWAVWPAVFHANLRLHELHSDRKIWGITYRSLDTRDLWDTFDDRPNLIAGLPGDDITPYLNNFDIRTRSIRAQDGLLLYATIPRQEIQFGKESPWPQVQMPPAESKCTLDIVNGNGDAMVSVERRRSLELLGWAADVSGGKVPEAVGIEIRSPEKDSYFVQATRTTRTDVASFFNNPQLKGAGFILRIADTRVPPGEYAVHVWQSSGDQAWSCDTQKRVRVY